MQLWKYTEDHWVNTAQIIQVMVKWEDTPAQVHQVRGNVLVPSQDTDGQAKVLEHIMLYLTNGEKFAIKDEPYLTEFAAMLHLAATPK
jgi:hypothetical protein